MNKLLKKFQRLNNFSVKLLLPGSFWLQTFILLQFIFQISLLIPGAQVVRVPLRTGAFVLSLLLLFCLRGSKLKHPSQNWAIVVLVILSLEFFWNPYLNSVPAGLAQFAMYLAILGPLFWVNRLKVSVNSLRCLISIMWGFHTLSSIFGVLQVYYPSKFQFAVSTVIQNSPYGIDALQMTLANGQQVFRPMGLTDVPGGAATSGFYALLLGTGIALEGRHPLIKAAGIGGAAIGLFCIYLSQVRSILFFAVIALFCLGTVLARQGKFVQLTSMLTGAISIGVSSLVWAISIGGESTSNRLLSLFSSRLDNVVYENRGHFLENTLKVLLPKYPFGAGLGRWGMMNSYFGDNTNPFTAPLWVEIQWTGWLLDGGIPIIVAYMVALYLACRTAWKIALSPKLKDLSIWAGVIFGYNIGALAITFNYPIFNSQSGMEFWLINTALYIAACHLWQKQVIQEPES